MIKAIMKIHTTSSSVTFVCGDVAIIGNGEFRASSGKVDGFILYADTLQYENGAKLSRDEQENLKRDFPMKCYQIEHRSKEESYGMAKTGADSGLGKWCPGLR